MAVYIIEEQKSKRVKIGFTDGSVLHRLASIQTGNPEPLEIVHVYPHGDRAMESRLHRRFQKHRLQGEWFEPKGEVWNHLADIKNRQNRDYLRNFMKPQSPRQWAIDLGLMVEENGN